MIIPIVLWIKPRNIEKQLLWLRGGVECCIDVTELDISCCIDVTDLDISCWIDVTELDISCFIDVTDLDISCCIDVTELDIIGYEPADLTVHPPPPRTAEGGFIFFV